MKQIARLGWLGTDAVDGLDGQSFADLTARLAGVESTAGSPGWSPGSSALTRRAEISCMEWSACSPEIHCRRPRPPVDILTPGCWRRCPTPRVSATCWCSSTPSSPASRPPGAHHLDDGRLRHSGGDSSMNRTVGLPAAVGVRFILEGRFTKPG